MRTPSRGPVHALVLAGLFLVPALWSVPAKARDAEVEDEATAVDRYPPSSVRLPIILGGSGLFAAAYGTGAACAAGWPEVPGASSLYVPIVGPWMALGKSGCAADDPNCDAILYMRGILYVVSGLAQAGGFAIAAQGIFMTTESEQLPQTGLASIRVTPIATPSPHGIGWLGASLSGRF